ncbi:MAG TPA: hypothetical protein VHD86_19705, partial [Xanthobacteraceae bacterium]|nr:hypothetical protein [Xanthobacteraceae bacterium]
MVSSEWKTRFAIRDFAIRNHRTATFVRAIRPWRDRGAQDRVRRTDERTNGRKKEKEAERRQTRVYLLALRQARTLQGALACRRSTAVLPLGLTHPKVRRR